MDVQLRCRHKAQGTRHRQIERVRGAITRKEEKGAGGENLLREAEGEAKTQAGPCVISSHTLLG